MTMVIMNNETANGDENMNHVMPTPINCKLSNGHTPTNGVDKHLEENYDHCGRKPVLKRALMPLLVCMRLVGLYYERSSNSFIYRWNKSFSHFVSLIILGSFVYSITLLWYAKTSNDYFIYSVIIVYSLKGCIQTFVLLHISCECSLWKFIEELNEFLRDIKLTDGIEQAERKFMTKVRVGFVIQIIGTLMFVIQNLFLHFENSFGFMRGNELVHSLRSGPFMEYKMSHIVKSITDIMMLTAWISPIALSMTLIHSLTYTFEEFYRYLESVKHQTCTRAFLTDVRMKFQRLTELSETFDDIVSLMLMFSYLLDIVMACLLLRMVVFAHSDLFSRLIYASWLMMPSFSLLVLSNIASKLYDTGQSMRKHTLNIKLKNIDLDTKAELDLLLFHINSEPVVLTIWKMIPLNRSIIVSIFVSIVTYFTMLISFM